MADEEEEEVFGFSGNVFVESIDVKERERLNEERKAAARKAEEERRRKKMEALAKKGLEYEEKLKAQEREREAEFESQREQARIKETRVAHTHKAEDDDVPSSIEPLPKMSTLPPVAELDPSGGADGPVQRRSSGDGGGGGGGGGGGIDRSGRRGSTSVVSSWEMTMVSGVNAGTIARERAKARPVDRIAGGGITAPPNNFVGRSNITREHTVGGSYVPDRLLEAHRRMHKAELTSDADGRSSATTASAPLPKSLFRSSDQVISRANAWIKSFSIETTEEMEARMRREIEEGEAAKQNKQ